MSTSLHNLLCKDIRLQAATRSFAMPPSAPIPKGEGAGGQLPASYFCLSSSANYTGARAQTKNKKLAGTNSASWLCE